MQYEDWWFNVKPSPGEALLQLNLEAKDDQMLEDRLAELCPLLGDPLDQPR